jgi:hypothetical protein
MPYDSCTILTAKVRRLGYPRRYAERLARFLFLQMVLIDVVLDLMDVPARALWERITGFENPAAEPSGALALFAVHSIQR